MYVYSGKRIDTPACPFIKHLELFLFTYLGVQIKYSVFILIQLNENSSCVFSCTINLPLPSNEQVLPLLGMNELAQELNHCVKTCSLVSLFYFSF